MNLRKLFVGTIATASILLGSGVMAPPGASAEPLPGGGDVRISATECRFTVTTKNIGEAVIESQTIPRGEDEPQIDDVKAVDPSLTVDVPKNAVSDVSIEVVVNGKIIWSQDTTLSCGQFDVYTTPGYHELNNRKWFTECEPYSQTVRCRTSIWATQVTYEGAGKFTKWTGWSFNNLTYKPSPRELWKDNPLGNKGQWTGSDGHLWQTECDTTETGRNGCRSYRRAHVANHVGGGKYVVTDTWVFNNIVRFGAIA